MKRGRRLKLFFPTNRHRIYEEDTNTTRFKDLFITDSSIYLNYNHSKLVGRITSSKFGVQVILTINLTYRVYLYSNLSYLMPIHIFSFKSQGNIQTNYKLIIDHIKIEEDRFIFRRLMSHELIENFIENFYKSLNDKVTTTID